MVGGVERHRRHAHPQRDDHGPRGENITVALKV